METIDIVNKIAMISCINIITYIVFKKLINYKVNDYRKEFLIVTISIVEAIVYVVLLRNIMILYALLIMYIVHSIIIAKITKHKIYYSIIVIFTSLVITVLIYLIALLLSAIILKIFLPNIQSNNILILFTAAFIEIALIYRTFKIKRLKNGVIFIKDAKRFNNLGILEFAFIGITLLIYSKNKDHNEFWTNTYLCLGIIIEAICMTIWIRRKITKYYKQKMKEKTIEDLENEIKEKDIEINKILDENKEIATINHKYSSRISALEKFSAQILSKPEIIETMKAEFGADFGEMQEQIKKLSEEYTNEITDKIKHENNLVKTGIFGIDNMLEYMKEEAENCNIKFDLKINGNINYMIENIIDQSKLETLLGDHLKDAIIAIKCSDNTYKSILTIIGIIDDCYEICIYDTGIEFEIETLLKLGKEAVTTHKDTGGSGIGFMTTFETLRETNGSLIIEEKHPITNTYYTKAVKIKFDGKREYKIISYRAEKIKEQVRDNKIIIQEL